jgi:hypothetical protein
LWVRLCICGFLCADANKVLQTLNVDFGRVLAFEEVDEQALRQCVFCLVRVFEDSTVEGNKRLQADAGLLVLELLKCAEGVRVDVKLKHVEDFVGEGASEGEAVWALFGVEREEKE